MIGKLGRLDDRFGVKTGDAPGVVAGDELALELDESWSLRQRSELICPVLLSSSMSLHACEQ